MGSANKWLAGKKIKVRRILSGAFMTSLSMPGFSLTLLVLPREGDTEGYSASQILKLMDAPASAPGWKYYAAAEPGFVSEGKEETVHTKTAQDVALARECLEHRAI
jgi:dihydroxyacetone kinase